MKIDLKNSLIQHSEIMTKTYIRTIQSNDFLKQIGHIPFDNQLFFLTYPSEELLYGGQAGGGKSDALLMAALQYINEPEDYIIVIPFQLYNIFTIIYIECWEKGNTS